MEKQMRDKSPGWNSDGGQDDKVMACGCEGRSFESSRYQATYPFDSPLLAASFPKGWCTSLFN